MSLSPFGPWLKTPAQADPGGEWLKAPTSLVCQLRRPCNLTKVNLFSVLKRSTRDCRTAATLLNRACLRKAALPCQVRPWRRVIQRACATGACCNLALPLSIPVGTLQFPFFTGCVSGLAFRSRLERQEWGLALRPARQVHVGDPYEGGTYPWRVRRLQQGKLVMCGNDALSLR
eukprot:1749267-Amphidinium_carterae.1